MDFDLSKVGPQVVDVSGMVVGTINRVLTLNGNGRRYHEFVTCKLPLRERLVLIVSTKSSAVLTTNFFGLWEFGRQNPPVLEVLGTTQ